MRLYVIILIVIIVVLLVLAVISYIYTRYLYNNERQVREERTNIARVTNYISCSSKYDKLIPRFAYAKGDPRLDAFKTDSCSICLEVFAEKQMIR